MILWLGLVAIVTAILEIAVVVRVAHATGIGTTLLLLVLCSAGGAWIVKHEGLAAIRRLRDTVSSGRIPTREVVDGAMVLAAGALLLPPGFITSLLGLLLVLPPVRRMVGGEVADHLRVRVARRMPTAGRAAGAAAGAAGRASSRWYREASGRPTDADDVIDVEGEEIDLTTPLRPRELGPIARD